MTEETKTNPVVMAGDLITGPGLYEARCGHIVPISGWDNGWWVSECDGVVDWFSSDGLQRCRANTDVGQWDLVRWVAPLPASEAEPETTTEQLAEIEGQVEPVQVREGRWRTRNGLVKDVTAMPKDHEDFAAAYPWWDGVSTWRNDGRWLAGGSTMDLLEYLGPIEQDETQELPTKTQELPDKTQELPEYTPPDGWRVLAVGEVLQAGDMWVWPTNDQLRQTVHVGAVVGANQRYIRRIKPQPQPEPNAAAIEELRREVSYVQNLLGTERRRVTELEELVTSLRTINRGCENAVRDAGKENTALRNQLAAVKAELTSVAADRYRLQIELDAAQQVPADSPELRQLRADLAEVTQDRDTYRHAHELLMNDANTAHERTKAMTVEAIAEWLEPIRLVDNPNLANETLQHLPQIMRHLTGLDSHAID